MERGNPYTQPLTINPNDRVMVAAINLLAYGPIACGAIIVGALAAMVGG